MKDDYFVDIVMFLCERRSIDVVDIDLFCWINGYTHPLQRAVALQLYRLWCYPRFMEFSPPSLRFYELFDKCVVPDPPKQPPSVAQRSTHPNMQRVCRRNVPRKHMW
jgi:hypothetical protein